MAMAADASSGSEPAAAVESAIRRTLANNFCRWSVERTPRTLSVPQQVPQDLEKTLADAGAASWLRLGVWATSSTDQPLAGQLHARDYGL